MKNKKNNKTKKCCFNIKKKPKNKLEAILFGLVPHIGCIGFLIGSIFGVTFLMQFFRPLLMNRYFFHYLILLSLVFATISSFFYLKKHKSLTVKGIIREKKYLSWTYGLTVGVNIILFLFVFPFLANVDLSEVFVGNSRGLELNKLTSSEQSLNFLRLKVDIPCPGHAPLISYDLNSINGVKSVRYEFPNFFIVNYDSETNKDTILSLDVFQEYPAEVLEENLADQDIVEPEVIKNSCGTGCLSCQKAKTCGCA